MMTDGEWTTGWDQFMFWVEKFISDPAFTGDERDYKLVAVEPLASAVSEVRSGGSWYEPLHLGLQNQKNNLVNWRSCQRFLDWAEQEPSACGEGLTALWAEGNLSGSDRVEAFDQFVPVDVSTRPGGLCNLAAYLLGGLDPVRWPNYRITALDLAYELARFSEAPSKSAPSVHYGHALSFFDAMMVEAKNRDFTIKDRLDAQGVMWVIAGGGAHGPYDLTAEEWSQFDAFVEVPSKLRQERARKSASTPQKKRRPGSQVCPRCGHDDEVVLVGPAEDQWEFECLGGSQHGDRYSWLVRG